MALGMNWEQVEQRLDHLSSYSGLSSTIDAMKRILYVLREDTRLDDVQRGVSHAALRFGYPAALAFVLVGWTDQEGYSVSIWAPSGAILHRSLVAERDVPAVVHQYLKLLL